MAETSDPLQEGGSRQLVNLDEPALQTVCSDLRHLAEKADEEAWPRSQFDRLAEAGVLGWVIPAAYDGLEITPAELIYAYQHLARADLVTTFILTQRNGACQRIAAGDNDDLKAELLPPLAAGESFATVGISHLTTSRQHLDRPAVVAQKTDRGFLLEGTAPWVTGAEAADFIVTGGTCSDGSQILAAVPTTRDGVSVGQPPPLLAMNGSKTASVQLDGVEIEAGRIIAGPVEGVMKRSKGSGAGSLTTSALATGASAGSLQRLKAESDKRADLVPIYEPLEAERGQLTDDLWRSLTDDSAAEDPQLGAESIRKRANSLVLRSSQAYLAASKGAGFVKGHPAERAVREAMFFLVWSCPQPVLSAALREFACLNEA